MGPRSTPINRLREEIYALKAKLEALHPLPGSTEYTVIELLHNLGVAADRVQDVPMLAPQIFDLEHYWLHSVDWCSTLSKEIEKILIIQEELSTGR